MLMTKSVYDPLDRGDGIRVLVARFWPCGGDSSRNGAASWPPALFRRYKDMEIPWDEFAAACGREIDSDAGRRAVEDLRSRAESSDVTLLCYEPAGARCRRHLLRRMMHSQQRARPDPRKVDPARRGFGGSSFR